MKPATAEWIAKAEGDFRTACREEQAADLPNFDAVCFHAQQTAEKYLKARWVEADQDFPKIHDLDALLNLNLPLEPGWRGLHEALQRLTDLAVEVRHPGLVADAEDPAEAVRTATPVREAVRASLGLPT